jgi:hypothetical protein
MKPPMSTGWRQSLRACCGVVLLCATGSSALARVTYCPGDCDDDEDVTIDELLSGINIALGEADIASCRPFDPNVDDRVTVEEVVAAVNSALVGCPPIEDTGCNGDASLCDRRYDEVLYPTAHNAMANADEGFQGPNQNHSISCQLEDGVRALMLDTYEYLDDVYLCHAECSFLGHKLLLDGLAEIRRFLQRHPGEVVSIIFEAYVSAEATAAVFSRRGCCHMFTLNRRASLGRLCAR